ncbi:MAG: hypothetical protein IPJ22_00005, partial [Bacteroidetes bacterium]|nr:hypothetical protein [Bacteroidota bacterium]
MEKYFDTSRHVEFQIFAINMEMRCIYLKENVASNVVIKKVVEESPSPFITQETAKKWAMPQLLHKAINYDNAGTVEFIVAPDQSFYFLEVNTRLQVEHPITEEVTGLDLVRLQIEVAEGNKIAFTQEEITQCGHAIEVRVYAEDAAN